MPKTREPAFPKVLHVKIEEDSGTTYFVSDRDMASLAEQGSVIEVATYELVRVDKVTLTAQIVK